MIDSAIRKITDEAMSMPEGKRSLAIMFEEHLTEKCTNETIAKMILEPDRSLKKFTEDIWKQAKEKAKGGALHWPDSELFELLEDYYGIGKMQNTASSIDIMDLL